MTTTASVLLEKVLEFLSLTPHAHEWNEQSLINNPPRLIRLQQIKTLFKALNIAPVQSHEEYSVCYHNSTEFKLKTRPVNQIQFFLDGRFISNKELSAYKMVTPTIIQYSRFKKEPINISDVIELFKLLISYRTSVYNLFNQNSGFLLASGNGFFAANHLIKESNNQLSNQIKTIDDLLVHIIDPAQRNFSAQELVDKFGFSLENLDDIDIEYL